MAGAAAALAQLPDFLDAKGWLEEARAQTPDATRDTLNGLVAFVVPGTDPYSVAQGETDGRPGAIEAGTTELLIELLDGFVRAGGSAGPEIPSSGGVATMLNQTALSVNPAAARGSFPSPFSRLSFDEKVEVFRRLESMTEGAGELRFVAGILIGAVAFLAYGEGGVIDPATRQPTTRPVGWDLSGYDGIAEGRPELKGYYERRRRVRTSRRYRLRRRRRRG
jgi:hypothetical protein